MSRQNLIMIGAVAVVALVAFVVTGSALIGLLLLLIGVAGAFVLQKRQADGSPRGAGKAFFEAPDDGSGAPVARTAAPPTPAPGEGLPTWDAGQALPTWGGLGDTAPAAEESYGGGSFGSSYDETSYEESYETASYDEATSYDETSYDSGGYGETYETETTTSTWSDSGDTWSEAGGESSWSGEESSWSDSSWSDTPVIEEAQVDEPVANVTSLFGGGGRPAPINEEVSTADEIMEASKATELHLGEDAGPAAGDDNSELAKLLAKVQARLAAYE